MHAAIIALLAIATAAESDPTTIRGVVVNAQDRPIAGARVDVSDAKPLVGKSQGEYLFDTKFGITDRDGRFEIGDFPSSLQFRLRYTAPGKKTLISEWLTSTHAQKAKLDDITADTPVERVVQGKVVDSEGHPIAHALVRPYGFKLYSQPNIYHGYVRGCDSTSTDENGRFQIYAPDEYESVSFIVIADGFVTADSGQFLPGPARNNVVSLNSGGRIVGRVVHDGLPQANMKIAMSVFDPRGPSNARQLVTKSNADGRFSFEHLPAQLHCAIFSPLTNDAPALVLKTARFQSGPLGETRDLGELQLVPSVAIQGCVDYGEANSPKAGDTLVIHQHPEWDWITIDLGNDGKFQISGLPPEAYEFNIGSDEWEVDPTTIAYQLSGYWTRSRGRFALLIENDRKDLRIPVRDIKAAEKRAEAQALHSPGGRISQSFRGVVIDRHGQPVGGLTLTLQSLPGAAALFARSSLQSNKDGSFQIENIPFGPMEIAAFGVKNMFLTGDSNRVRFAAYVLPEINQQDIVIVYDESLNYPIEEIKARPVEETKSK
jgi:hypothetical protein